MDAAEQRPEDDDRLTITAFVDRLKALETAQPCAACGHEQWEPQARLVVAPTVVNGLINPLEGLECVALICKVCGYVRLHSTGLLEHD